MQLFLGNKPWDTDYRLDGGEIIYKVSSPWKHVPRKTMIQRVQPADATTSESRDAFEDMAVIEYHIFSASKTRFLSCGADAKNVGLDELFKTQGGRYKKREDQIFFGPDGKEYTWRMSEGDCELFYFKDSIWTTIARYQRAERSIFGKSRRAVLNITAENESHETLRNLILLTFVYLESLRVESNTPKSGAFMAGGG